MPKVKISEDGSEVTEVTLTEELQVHWETVVKSWGAYNLELIGGKGLRVNGQWRGSPSISMSFKRTTGLVHLECKQECKQGDKTLSCYIPCALEGEDLTASIKNMVDVLAGRKGQNSPAMNWMLETSGSNRKVHADDPFQTDERLRAKRGLTFCEIARQVLATLEACLPKLRSHPLSRTQPRDIIVPVERARQIGRNEVSWLELNTDMFTPIRQSKGLLINGKHYVVEKVRTSLPQRCMENRENEAILSFVASVASQLNGPLACELKGRLAEIEGIKQGLSAKASGTDGTIPALEIATACIELEERQIDGLDELQRTSRRLLRSYEAVLGKAPRKPFVLPKRTKPFQEVPHYARIWQAMNLWDRFGVATQRRETLLMDPTSMDVARLYEYYVLHQMLTDLVKRGFALVSADQPPFELPDYISPALINTQYELVRGEGNDVETIVLYYQPIVLDWNSPDGDCGVDLRRTVSGSDGGPSCWAPDYVLYHTHGTTRDCYVLDAKFRTFDSLETFGEFDRCVAKYRAGMARRDPEDTPRGIDGMWLIYGREGQDAKKPEKSYRSTCDEQGFRDGLHPLIPGSGCISGLLDKLIGT